MYVGPWQEYKLMRLIGEMKAENESLRRRVGDGSNGTARSTASSGTSITLQNLPGSRRYAESASGNGDGTAPPTPSEASIRSAPAGTSAAARDLLSSMLRGPPSSHELEQRANVRRPPLRDSLPARKRSSGVPTAVAAGIQSGDDDERARRRAMLSMLYSGGDVDASERDAMVREIEDAERARLLRMQHQGGASGAAPRQRRVPSASASRRPSSATRRQQPPPHAQLPQHPQQAPTLPSSNALGLVNRNVIRDIADAGSSGAMALHSRPTGATALVPWDNLGPLPPVSVTPAPAPSQPVALDASPTMIAFLDEQRRRVDAGRHAPAAAAVPQLLHHHHQSLPFQHDQYKPIDAQQTYRTQRPYDTGAPVRPVVGDIGAVYHHVLQDLASAAPPTAAVGVNLRNSGVTPIAGENGSLKGASLLGSSVTPPTLPPPLSVEALQRPPLSVHQSPVRPLRTEPRSGDAVTPNGTRRPLSTATDGSLDFDVGGLLQWTTSLGQRDSWGRLPGDPHYGLGSL